MYKVTLQEYRTAGKFKLDLKFLYPEIFTTEYEPQYCSLRTPVRIYIPEISEIKPFENFPTVLYNNLLNDF